MTEKKFDLFIVYKLQCQVSLHLAYASLRHPKHPLKPPHDRKATLCWLKIKRLIIKEDEGIKSPILANISFPVLRLWCRITERKYIMPVPVSEKSLATLVVTATKLYSIVKLNRYYINLVLLTSMKLFYCQTRASESNVSSLTLGQDQINQMY